jgi:hypothetical protein
VAIPTAGTEYAMKTFSLTLGPDDIGMIEQIVQRLPLSTRHAVGRAAMRIGLEQMHRDHGFALDALVRETEKRRKAA